MFAICTRPKHCIHRLVALPLTAVLVFAMFPPAAETRAAEEDDVDAVHVANLVYARNKTTRCFSSRFLADLEAETGAVTADGFDSIHVESEALYEYPFAIMSGEGAFTLTADQRENLRGYLRGGGFVVASAGCSSHPWRSSFRREVARVLPEAEWTPMPADHPIFSTVYEIDQLENESSLEGIRLDGRLVAVFSEAGLNDTADADGNCSCCGGNEIENARQVNVNLLAYALTH